MLYAIIIFAIILFISFILFAPNNVKESFTSQSQSQYVIPENNAEKVRIYNPDVDWLEYENKMKQQMKTPTKTSQETTKDSQDTTKDSQDTSMFDKIEQDAESVLKTLGTDIGSLYDSSTSSSSLPDQQIQEHPLFSDQRYILQKQKTAPRFIPKFTKPEFLVYKPDTPELHYATRPGPNSFNDILSEAAHIETPQEKQEQQQAQQSAQERHEDLLRRTNWVFQSASRWNTDHILKQPKTIPGPANNDKYIRRYSKYGLA